MNLTLDERTKIFDKVCRLVETKHFNPAMNGADWNALVRSRRDQILACSDPEAFEKEVNRLVAELKTSHTGFRHAGMRNIPARHAINATLNRLVMNGTDRWMFQDVHRGGPAYLAGIRPGDLLVGMGEREIRPPEDLTFSAGESAQLTIQKLDGGVQGVTLQLPMPKSKKHPVTAPEAVHAEMLTYEIGLLKVAMFPGAIGIDVAKDIDRGIASAPLRSIGCEFAGFPPFFFNSASTRKDNSTITLDFCVSCSWRAALSVVAALSSPAVFCSRALS